jgi:hypothetical protein
MASCQWAKSCLLMAVLLALSAGCACLRAVDGPPPEFTAACRSFAPEARRHVYVLLMSGADPFQAANLRHVREYVHALGFAQTFHGQFCNGDWLEEQMIRIRLEDADARVVLIGCGSGAATLCELGEAAAADGMTIEAMLVLGQTDIDVSQEHMSGPFPVRRLAGFLETAALAQIALELSHAAAKVPVLELPAPLPLEPLTPPRPLVPVPPVRYGPDWDSLRPVQRIESPVKSS